MTPKPFSNDIVAVRLRMIRDLLAQLRDMGQVTRSRLEAEPVARAAAERFIQSIVDMAIDVNSHIAVTRLDRAPTNGKEIVPAGRAGGRA